MRVLICTASPHFGERAIVTAFKVPDGDFRDWEEIRVGRKASPWN